MFNSVRPDVVIHAAALTNVDKCELEQDTAYKINVLCRRNIVNYAAKNALLWFIFLIIMCLAVIEACILRRMNLIRSIITVILNC